MASIVLDLQRDILESKKGLTEILRTAKVISAKLGLVDISKWVDIELNGYLEEQLPSYRRVSGGMLQVLNPVRGWQSAGPINIDFPVDEPIPTIEELVTEPEVTLRVSHHFEVHTTDRMDSMVNQWQQQIVFTALPFKKILETVKNKILEWTLELESRGIKGEGMSFDRKEKESAKTQIFHIQQFTGVLGNVEHSDVNIYNYASIHQTLKDAGVPQDERNELENIMDVLQKAHPNKKAALIEKAKKWLVKNEKFLGASIDIVRKAFGVNAD